MKKTFTKPATAVFCLLLCMQTQAQTFGIAQTPNGTGATYSTKEINVETSPNATYTVYATYPTDTTAYSHIRWYVYGGIEKVSESATHLTFRSASGTTYNDKYSKYAYGQVQLSATLSDQTVADCECATMCNPTRTANLFVYKRFDFSANHIIGPDCVLSGDSVTFSVEPWLTLYPTLQLDTAAYFWDIPIALQASPLYYSSDKSSVTFVVSDSIENKTIKCSIGRLNYADGQLPIEKPLSNDVADPIITLAGVPFNNETHSVCLPFGVDSVDLVVTNASPELEYSWNLRAWDYSYRKLTTNGSALRILPTDNMVSIKLSVQNGCSDKEYYYDINRSLSSANAIYLNDTTEHSLCLAPNSNVTLSISGVDAVTTFDWHFAANASQDWQVLKNGTSRGTIRTGSTSTTLYVSTAVCGNDSISIPINVKPLTPTINYRGSTCLSDTVSSVSLSVNEEDNADYYSWLVPNGWGISTQTPDSSVVTLIPNGIAGLVSVRAIGCAESSYRNMYFSMAYDAPEVEIDGCVSLSSGYTSLITLSADDTNKRYNWAVPSSVGQIVSSDTHASSILVRTVAMIENGIYEIEVEPQGSCSSNASTTIVIPTEIPYTFESVIVGKHNFLTIDNVTGIASYTLYIWDNDAYVYAVDGDSTDIIEEEYSLYDISRYTPFYDYLNEGSAKIEITTVGGCHYTSYLTWGGSKGNKSLSMSEEPEVKISPNPANDRLNVYVSCANEFDHGTLEIYSLKGILQKKVSISNGVNNVNIAEISKGLYAITVHISDKIFEFKQQIK